MRTLILVLLVLASVVGMLWVAEHPQLSAGTRVVLALLFANTFIGSGIALLWGDPRHDFDHL